jgi:hypothetical protein
MPDSRELVICYELVDTLYLLGMRANTIKHDAPTRGKGGTGR